MNGTFSWCWALTEIVKYDALQSYKLLLPGWIFCSVRSFWLTQLVTGSICTNRYDPLTHYCHICTHSLHHNNLTFKVIVHWLPRHSTLTLRWLGSREQVSCMRLRTSCTLDWIESARPSHCGLFGSIVWHTFVRFLTCQSGDFRARRGLPDLNVVVAVAAKNKIAARRESRLDV